VNWLYDISNSVLQPPTGVAVIDGAIQASVSGTLVTVGVPIQPSGHVHRVTLDLRESPSSTARFKPR
jgi:hypothetical protein